MDSVRRKGAYPIKESTYECFNECNSALCGWDGRWCWPGTCSSNYEKNCSCERDFRKQKDGSKTMCQHYKRFEREHFYHGSPECDNAVSDKQPRQTTSCTGTIVPGQTLRNGESICINFVPYAGGFLNTEEGLTEIYKRTNTNRELCFMYDDHAPEHCKGSISCRNSMLHLSHHVTNNPLIDVTFSSWHDPTPPGGSSNKASGIKQFVVSVLRVEGLDKTTMVMKYPGISTKNVLASGTHTSFKLQVEPALYAVLLEVHDIAGNVRMSRRFVLYDQSSTVAILPQKHLQSLTASSKTNYTWQVNHGLTCFNWTGRYYNTYHVNINLLRRIKSEGNISSSYDQTEGLIPVSGTPNIDGIVRFDYTWKLKNGTYKAYSTVSDISTQSFCENLTPLDGQTYKFKIKPIDINSRYLEETTVVHIDRSPPSIDNIWVLKEGYKQLFVHNSSDLSKMSLQFEALDLHSGLYSIYWKLGTSDGSNDIGEGSLAVNRINGTCAKDACYCPKIGVCEHYLYTVGLNKLVDKRTNKGQHNRNYYFTIIATNNAKLVNIEHLDVLTDDSPPEEGVIQEGVAGSPDVDYTSENEIIINWHGYIDHESGIKFYRVGLSDRCLSRKELDQLNKTLNNTQIIETSRNSEKFRVDTDGYYISSIVAYNNAMEPSKVVCSDGLRKDSTAPLIVNVTLKHSKAMELFACDSSGPWHVRSDLTRVALIPTDICMRRCISSTFEYLQNLPEAKVNSYDKDVADYLCTNLPNEVENWYIYIPSSNIDISWKSLDNDSQIRREEVGFASDPSSIISPDIEVYRETHGHSRYHNVHEGIDSEYPFFIIIRTTNKAGMEKALALGPIVIDDTPPINQRGLHVHLEKNDDKIYCSWDNNTFIDPEQKHAVDYVLYKIGADDKFFTPLLQLPPEEKCIRKDLMYCVHYPISKLQRQDEEKSLQFFFELYVYNMAGHFTTLRSSTFELPSQFPPGNGHVFDIDPALIHLSSSETDSRFQDVDVHVSVGTICFMWTGFNHHKNVIFHMGVGTKSLSDDIIQFKAAGNTEQYKCLHSSLLQSNMKYFVTINATCSAGSRIVSSDGVYIMDEKYIDDFISVDVGISCDTVRRINLERHENENSTNVTFVSHAPLAVGHGYTIESESAIPLDEIIISDDVLWVDKPRVTDGKFRSRFVAFSQTVSLTVSTRKDSENSLFNMTLLDCFENITTTSTVDSGYVSLALHENISNLITEYKASVFQDDCTNDTEPRTSCLVQHSETLVSGTERVFKLTNLTLLDSMVYRIGVSICFRHICLQSVFSSQFFVQSMPPTTNQINASATQGNETCLDVDLEWTKFNCIGTLPFSEKYEWSLRLSANSDGKLTRWEQVHLDDRTEVTNVK
ncbi:uncharacterized protein LOC128546093, partial [Mercenaria mercenaria]|uniref:uncharacterized protein LOC128546093 n=1 Tax=Mercenaria mercenaria TaxID=6596 RepID=UPI00234F25FD